MATDFQKLKFIDQHTQDCVYGFIRKNYQRLLLDDAYHAIPKLIFYTCVLYYHVAEYFTEYGPNVILSQDGSMVSIEQGKNFDENQIDYDTNYGNIEIDLNIPMFYQWIFKVIKLVDVDLGDEISIGICSKRNTTKGHISDSSESNYYLNNSGSINPNRGVRVNFSPKRSFGTDDEIKMEFDTKKNILKFYINDKPYAARENVTFLLNCLCMAVSLDSDQPNSIQLLSFQMQNR